MHVYSINLIVFVGAEKLKLKGCRNGSYRIEREKLIKETAVRRKARKLTVLSQTDLYIYAWRGQASTN